VGKEPMQTRVLLGKPARKRPLGRSRCGWEDDINMGIKNRINV
jgi:hypothetical protein